jgi:adenylate kinase
METELQHIRNWLGTGSINIFGMPFAGKDTQAQVLADLFGGTVLGGGEILRNSVIPDHVAEVMAAGGLIPTEDYIQIVLPYLSKSEFRDKPLILSSVGRWQGEENGVLGAAEEAGHPIKAVILLKVDEQTARKRHDSEDIVADRGIRIDDSPEKLTNRFNEFRIKTLPVIDHYRELGLLIEIDGGQTPPQVTQEIIAHLSALANPA